MAFRILRKLTPRAPFKDAIGTIVATFDDVRDNATVSAGAFAICDDTDVVNSRERFSRLGLVLIIGDDLNAGRQPAHRLSSSRLLASFPTCDPLTLLLTK
ncbi:hypothetical protein SLS58_010304 [Diplodia intermedia]|uniref:Uncharacterized protein n=1 Tax=Diplodia intermedia TaxID=856260 RepID=A0ABR3T6Y4_9PEZI